MRDRSIEPLFPLWRLGIDTAYHLAATEVHRAVPLDGQELADMLGRINLAKAPPAPASKLPGPSGWRRFESSRPGQQFSAISSGMHSLFCVTFGRAFCNFLTAYGTSMPPGGVHPIKSIRVAGQPGRPMSSCQLLRQLDPRPPHHAYLVTWVNAD